MSGTASAINLTIGATDKTGAAMAAINKSLEAFSGATQKQLDRVMSPMQRQMERLTAGTRGFVDGSKRMATGFGNIARSAGNAFQTVGQLVPVLGLVTGAASVAGMQRLTSSWAEWGLKVSQTAQRIGMNSRQLVGMEGAATLAGSSADAMAGGLQNLGQTMYDAIGGRAPEAIVMFRTMNIAFQDGFGKARKAADVMPEIADKIASIRDPFAQAQAGVTLFSGAWQELAPLLTLGSKRMRELEATANRYSFTTDASIEGAKDLALAQREVGLSVDGLRNRIAERLAPVLGPMLKHFADWLATSPEVTKMVTWLGDAVGRLGKWVEGIKWDKVSEKLSEWGEKFKGVLALLQKFGLIPNLSGISGDTPAVTGPAAPAGNGRADTQWGREHLPTWLGGNSDSNNPVSPNAGTATTEWGRKHLPQWLGGDAPQPKPAPPPYTGPATQGTGNERNVRNNNPTNLSFAGQPGAVSDGRFAKFASMEAGVAADLNQYLLYQDRDRLKTIAGMVNKATPIADNPGVRDYIDRVAKQMGVTPNDPINLHDPDVARRFIMAVAPNEGGTPDVGAVERGVRFRLGQDQNGPRQPAAPALPSLYAPAAQGAPLQLSGGGQQSSAVDGKDGTSTIRLHIEGQDGYRAKVVSNPSKVDVGGPLVERPMLLGANP